VTAHPDRPIRAVAIVGDHLRHRWYAGRLAGDPGIELRGVVSERQPPQPRGAAPDEDALVAEHFAERHRAEERYFIRAADWSGLDVPFLAVGRGETNTDPVAGWVHEREPQYLLLFGCGIIRAPLLELFGRRTVNLHLGLSPYYRGHATNFWPLVRGEPECVGATVHVATLEVDAGAILRQARPAMSAEDGAHDIGCEALIAGIGALLAALPEYARGTLEPVPQGKGGNVYRHRDFDVAPGAAIGELRRRFSEGMMSEYLAHKLERDARFPIVE
jgi:folate-dependent phosphoribosylglycinamide formyltransferase PurN